MKYLQNVLLGLDVALNTLLGGSSKDTISSRVGRYLKTDRDHWVEHIPMPAWLRKHFLNANHRG